MPLKLKRMKLSGFKSFVDPTPVPFPSNMVGVVGPNGCGKSNIIDAVRWVMGESSAKYLRGDSIADVIFNGSTSRKPVGQASVELLFDNSDHSLGGEFLQFQEISIKRVVNRDGQSTYLLNGTRCRRKDITQIFLGTGLGPRSYAIIEQGMISRVVDAKPEDLRQYLEEAAGISKYKERRRETENRMRHTEENLNRVNDIIEELDKQLERLKRQARNAERYKVLKAEERLTKARLLVLKWQAQGERLQSTQQELKTTEEHTLALETERTTLTADFEASQEAQHEAQEAFNETQAHYYELAASIARSEEALQHQRERQQQYQQDLVRITQELNQITSERTSDQTEYEELANKQQQLAPEVADVEKTLHALEETLKEAEEAELARQEDWQAFNEQAANNTRNAELAEQRCHHIDEKLLSLQSNETSHEEELKSLKPDNLTADLNRANDALKAQILKKEAAEDALSSLETNIKGSRDTLRDEQQKLTLEQQKLHQAQGRLASLEALQQAALGKDDNTLTDWLNEQGLANDPRLGELLDVEPTWSRAVETVLSPYLTSVCSENFFEGLPKQQGKVAPQSLNVISSFKDDVEATGELPLTALRQFVTCDLGAVQALLQNIYTVSDLTEALDWLPRLAPHQSLVTEEGHWLNRYWCHLPGENDPQANLLRRSQTIADLQQSIEQQKETIAKQERTITETREHLETLETQLKEKRQTVQQATSTVADAQTDQRIAEREQQRCLSRKRELEETLVKMRAEQTDLHRQLQENKHAWDTAMQAMRSDSEKRDEWLSKRDHHHETLNNLREQVQSQRERTHKLVLEKQAVDSRLQHLISQLERSGHNVTQLTSRHEQLQTMTSDNEEPIKKLEKTLEDQLSAHVAYKETVANKRHLAEEAEQLCQDIASKREALHDTIQKSRDAMSQIQLRQQEIQLKQANLLEQLKETEHEREAVLNEMPEDADIANYEQACIDFTNKISRLGAINLAAIEEFEEESKRREYLATQHADLTQALETLSKAIHKIDKETREMFKATYDQVNESMQKLFPRLFGGGRAQLVLTEDDLLTAGVNIIAQPPGKRNSSIHLLSGGEKALTAVSLVFAIFQLNPAPFCLLDEVDAPLDDANVSRFCELVKEMSEKVQFIFITHNKVTMEYAQQLMGVTMHEPGVSRLVSVDVREAAELAEA